MTVGARERAAYLARLEGSCRTPIGGLARLENGTLTMSGQILKPDGSESYARTRSGTPAQALAIGMGFFPALLVTLLAGAVMGLINGVLTAKLLLPSFIVTVATMGIFRGLVSLPTNGALALLHGAAAMDVMRHLDVLKTLEPKFVQGENIAQTQQFIATGNAELGFVALSQVFRDGQLTRGSFWLIPENLYAPIRQDATLLKTGEDHPAAMALLAYLKSAAAKSIIQSLGYGL